MDYKEIQESLEKHIFIKMPDAKITIIDKKGNSKTHDAYKYLNINN